MTRYTVAIAAFGIAFSAMVASRATTLPTPGPAPPGSAIAYYYTWSGELTVSVDVGINWYIESDSFSLTGDPATNLPAASPPGVVTDTDQVIGEVTAFWRAIYTDVELGAVAEPFLPENDLTICWNENLSLPLECQPVVYIYVPEPTSLGLMGIGLGLIATVCRRTRA